MCGLILADQVSIPHEASLAHQVCLPHAHPPSALDRRRKGVAILQSYGWNPDERRGLGVEEAGILHPIKVSEKRDRLGLAEKVDDEQSAKLKHNKAPKKREARRLDAGKIRKLDDQARRRDDKLREMFYRDNEVEKYLGPG